MQLDDTDKSCWPIPITFVTSRDPKNVDTKPRYWLTCQELIFDIDLNANEYIIFNVNLMGKLKFLVIIRETSSPTLAQN